MDGYMYYVYIANMHASLPETKLERLIRLSNRKGSVHIFQSCYTDNHMVNLDTLWISF